MWRQLLVALAAAHAFVPRQQPRASLPLRAAADDLASLKKPALVALCRERGLKVSGTKAALLERLAGAEDEAAAPAATSATPAATSAAPPPPRPSAPPSAAPRAPPRAAARREPRPASLGAAFERGGDPQLVEASIDLLLGEVAALEPSAVAPAMLARREQLPPAGRALDAVAARRLAADPTDERVVGAVALVKGFARMEQQLRLARDGRLDGPLKRYVDDLIAQQAPKGGGAAAGRDRRDRIKAEDQMRGNDEPDQLATSSTSPRFDAYVADAALFLESSGAATSADEARLDRVRAIRDFVVEIRRGMPV
ncbi:hypothetical protein JL720_4816 [Aureococcus anophagefferens]|nr:hypothetical protein JL720_4816 [Aureococcus anophagefferens]